MRETTLASAYHNYLVDGRLRLELVVGDPGSADRFFFVAHPVAPGGPMPLLSGRFFGRDRELLLRVERNDLVENPNGFSILETQGGWVLMDALLETLLSAELRAFENGYLTVLRGVLHDEFGRPVLRGDDRGLHILATDPQGGRSDRPSCGS
jgi:hypothetical protein